MVVVSYGGENGYNRASELCAEILANVRFIQGRKLIGKYLISQDTGKYVFEDGELHQKNFYAMHFLEDQTYQTDFGMVTET